MNHPCWLGFLRLGLALVCLFGWDVAHVLSFHSPQAAVTSCRFAEITSEALPEEIRGVAANSARSRGGNLPYRRTARDRSVTSLRLKSWWDDDLPNILGMSVSIDECSILPTIIVVLVAMSLTVISCFAELVSCYPRVLQK